MFRSKARQWVGVMILALALLPGCERESTDPSPPAEPQAPAAGFQFLNIHVGTRLDDATRAHLEDQLGSEAAARRSPLDLTLGPEEVFSRNFPAIMALHRDLNHPPNERVEYEVVKLQYRHVPSDQPFQSATLFFDRGSGRPLLFRMRSRKQDRRVVDALESSYGPPQVLPGSGRIENYLLWRQSGQALIVSAERDRKGWPAYRTAIYYLDHLAALTPESGARTDRPGPSPF